MKHLFLFVFLLFSKSLLSQYKVDSVVKKEYLKLLENLPSFSKDEIIKDFKGKMGLLYGVQTDTLNKNDIERGLKPKEIELFDLDPDTGEVDTTDRSLATKEEISMKSPLPIHCSCSFKKDTLIINSGIYLFSGFGVTAKLYRNKIIATHTEGDSDDKDFKRTLKVKKESEITVPAKVNFLLLDRAPTRNTTELFGQISITSGDYYTYKNVFGLKNDYLHKRMNVQFLFRCDLKSTTKP